MRKLLPNLYNLSQKAALILPDEKIWTENINLFAKKRMSKNQNQFKVKEEELKTQKVEIYSIV